jgi:hypothetical protein
MEPVSRRNIPLAKDNNITEGFSMRARAELIALLSMILFVIVTTQCQRASATEPAVLKVANPLTEDQMFDFIGYNKTIGDTFLVNLEVFNVTGLASDQITLTWDPTILNYSNYKVPSNAVFPPMFYGGPPPYGPPGPLVSEGQLVYGTGGQPSFTGDGILFQIEFKIVAFGETLLHMDPYQPIGDTFILDSGLNAMPYTAVDGHYALTQPRTTGDVDGDGTVNLTDIYIVVNAFNSFPNKPKWNVLADVDGNGHVDMRDIALIVLNFGKHSQLMFGRYFMLAF